MKMVIRKKWWLLLSVPVNPYMFGRRIVLEHQPKYVLPCFHHNQGKHSTHNEEEYHRPRHDGFPVLGRSPGSGQLSEAGWFVSASPGTRAHLGLVLLISPKLLPVAIHWVLERVATRFPAHDMHLENLPINAHQEGVATSHFDFVCFVAFVAYNEQAVYFVTEVLGISSPLEKIAQDPHHFLKEYMPAFQVNIPFQSITLTAIDPHLRHRYIAKYNIS